MHRFRFATLALVVIALMAIACRGIANPEGWAQPAVEGEIAYVFLDRGELSAIRLDDSGGQVLWTFPDDDLEAEKDVDLEAVYTKPVITGDRIYIAGFTGELVAISLDGRLQPDGWWLEDGVDGDVIGGPVLADDRLVFGTTEGRLYVRSITGGGGVPGWDIDGIEVGGEIWAPPVVANGIVAVATIEGEVHAFDLESGAEAWSEPFEADAAIADLGLAGEGLLFVPSFDRHVYFVDLATGREVTNAFRARDWVWTGAAIADGIAYFGDFSGAVFAVDVATGDAIWTYEAEEKVKARPVVVGGSVVLADEKATIHFIDRETGTRLNAVPLSGVGKVRAPLEVAGDVAYIVTTDGNFFVADPERLTVIERQLRGGG